MKLCSWENQRRGGSTPDPFPRSACEPGHVPGAFWEHRLRQRQILLSPVRGGTTCSATVSQMPLPGRSGKDREEKVRERQRGGGWKAARRDRCLVLPHRSPHRVLRPHVCTRTSPRAGVTGHSHYGPPVTGEAKRMVRSHLQSVLLHWGTILTPQEAPGDVWRHFWVVRILVLGSCGSFFV